MRNFHRSLIKQRKQLVISNIVIFSETFLRIEMPGFWRNVIIFPVYDRVFFSTSDTDEMWTSYKNGVDGVVKGL